METLNAMARALRDTAQSASNAVASGVSGPVDLIAMGMRAAGLPVNRPFGGSEWMAQRGLTREVPMGIPRIVGETIGLAAPSVIAGKAPQIAAQVLRGQDAAKTAGRELGRTAAGRLEDHMVRQGMIQPITVWHGSPHRFDRFDASKIGTGEGAQAYGHGLYFAESPTVASSYKELVQRDPARLSVDGKAVSPDTMYGRAAEDVARLGISAALQKIDDNIRFNEKYAPDMAALYRDVRAQVEALDPTRVSLKEGFLYKVDLPDEHVARMLDWDKPLAQQAPEVRSTVQKAFPPTYISGRYVDPVSSQTTGRAMLDQLNMIANKRGEPGMRQAEPALRQAGIPGIRYLDAGSRGTGTGTSNFVVFPGNEDMLRIQEINGQPVQAVIDALRRSR